MLTNGVILAISGCDTLRPKHLVRPFVNSVRDTKYHNDLVMQTVKAWPIDPLVLCITQALGNRIIGLPNLAC